LTADTVAESNASSRIHCVSESLSEC